MQFLYPAYLYGLFLILIPVILHLFRLRRYKTVYFSNLKFLQDIEKSTKSRARLRDLVLLFIRILLISSLVLAFAQPYRPQKNQTAILPGQSVGLFVDQSLSMNNTSINGSVFDQAKRAALEEINRFPLETSFSLADPESPKKLVSGLDKHEIIDRISRMPLSSVSFSLNEIIELFNPGPDQVMIFSDFQKTFVSESAFADSIPSRISLFPIQSVNRHNLYFDSCWLEQPVHYLGSRISMNGILVNPGDQDYKQFPIDLIIGDSLVGRTTADLAANSRTTLSISYLPGKAGWQSGYFRISDFPLVFDNEFYFSFPLNQKTRICQLYDQLPNQFLHAVFAEDSSFYYEEFPATAFPKRDFSDYETILIPGVSRGLEIIMDELTEFVNRGGNLLIFPGPDFDIQSINSLAMQLGSPYFTTEMTSEELIRPGRDLEQFYAEISLNPEQQVNWPYLHNYYGFAATGLTRDYSILMESNSGRPVWISKNSGRGQIILAAFELRESATGLMKHPIFIPALYYLSTAETRNPVIYQRLASNSPIAVRLGQEANEAVSLRERRTGFSWIPQQEYFPADPDIRIYTNAFRGDAGFLEVIVDEHVSGDIAMNYPRDESDPEVISIETLEVLVKQNTAFAIREGSSLNSAEVNKTPETGIPADWILSKLLLILGLGLIIAETLLHRSKW